MRAIIARRSPTEAGDAPARPSRVPPQTPTLRMKTIALSTLAALALAAVAPAQDSKKEFEKRLAEIDKGDVAQLLDLAEWAAQNRMKKSAAELYEKVLALDAENEDARNALGHKKADGRWMNPTEYKAWLKAGGNKKKGNEKAAAEPAAAPAASNSTLKAVLKLGPVDMPALTKGFDKEIAEEGKALGEQLGVDIGVAASKHFALRIQGEQKLADEQLAYCEQIYAALCQTFGLPLEKPLWNGQANFYIFADEANFLDAFAFLDRKWAKLYSFESEEEKKRLRSGGRFVRVHSRNPAKFASLNAGFIDIPWQAYYANTIGMLVSANFAGPHRVPDRYTNWLDEGIAIWSSITYHGENLLYRVTNAKYDGKSAIANKNADSAYKLVCKEMASGILEQKPFSQLANTELNDLDYKDLAKCWSLTSFLIELHLDKFVELQREMRNPELPEGENPELAVRRHVERKLQKVFGWTPDQLDQEWAKYVKARY